MTARRPRKPQSQTATGKAMALTAAASTRYPAWPRDLVDLPGLTRDRRRALVWYDGIARHRTPEGWQATDAGRIALLARALMGWERESQRLMEGQGGDAALADRLHAAIGQLSRHLGLSRVIADSKIIANDAQVRAELQQVEPKADDLLAGAIVN